MGSKFNLICHRKRWIGNTVDNNDTGDNLEGSQDAASAPIYYGKEPVKLVAGLVDFKRRLDKVMGGMFFNCY